MAAIEDIIYERNQENGALSAFITRRGTRVEFFQDSEFGYVCLMDGKVQSATSDEAVYHKYLANLGRVYESEPKPEPQPEPERVLIVGSGEGCLAREVLARSNVKEVVMIDWDEEVVDAFRTKWKMWAGTVWEDPRLKVEIADIWEVLNRVDSAHMWKFDCILVDLFDLGKDDEDMERWENLMGGLANWLNPCGTLAAYCGMAGEDVAAETVAYLSGGGYWRRGIPCSGTGTGGILENVETAKIHVASFGGDAVFVRGKRAM
jgi:spermidine synthase